MFILMPVIFVLGILAIALEDKIKINKAAIALFMAISLWMILMFDAYDIFVERSSPLFQEFLTQNPEMANAPLKDQFITFITNRSIVYHLGNVSETLFFVMCSMLIVDIVDKHGGFRAWPCQLHPARLPRHAVDGAGYLAAVVRAGHHRDLYEPAGADPPEKFNNKVALCPTLR